MKETNGSSPFENWNNLRSSFSSPSIEGAPFTIYLSRTMIAYKVIENLLYMLSTSLGISPGTDGPADWGTGLFRVTRGLGFDFHPNQKWQICWEACQFSIDSQQCG